MTGLIVNADMWTDLVDPVTLTGYARARLESYERQRWGSLVDYLPNEFLNDIVARFVVGQTGLQPAAEFMSFDTESPLGSLPGAQRVLIELPKLGMKMTVSEYEQIRARGDTSDVILQTSSLRIVERLVDAISDRMEFERGYAIENASLLIDDETGFKQTGDWGRAAEHEVSADTGSGVFWDDTENATPIEDLLTWRDQYIATNGYAPGSLLTSTSVLTTLQRTKEMRALTANVIGGTPSIVTLPYVSQVLAAHGLPGIRVYDRIVNMHGTVQKVLSPEFMFMLPEPGGQVDGAKLGATYWGTTLEAGEPEYNIEALERPGIVVGSWKTRDPIALWIHAAAIGLACLGDANLSLRAQVLPETS